MNKVQWNIIINLVEKFRKTCEEEEKRDDIGDALVYPTCIQSFCKKCTYPVVHVYNNLSSHLYVVHLSSYNTLLILRYTSHT